METGYLAITTLLYLAAIIISIVAIVKYFYLCSDVTNLRKEINEINEHLFEILEQLEKLTDRNKKDEAK